MNQEIVEMSDSLFSLVGKKITESYGIKMPPDKKHMFQARLHNRLKELDINSFNDYAAILLDENNLDEFKLLPDYISTNKTEFFREEEHFRFLNTVVLPIFLSREKAMSIHELKFWSAGCSNGQEAYSIGIQLEEFRRDSRMMFDYIILSTDISGKMLRQAKEAIYPIRQISHLPEDFKYRYFLKSKNTDNVKVRLIKDLRDKVHVAYLNLMDAQYPFTDMFDVIFIRNTLIYFDRSVQMKVLLKVLNSLKTGGYLFVGHSESLIKLKLPMRLVAPSVYIKTNE